MGLVTAHAGGVKKASITKSSCLFLLLVPSVLSTVCKPKTTGFCHCVRATGNSSAAVYFRRQATISILRCSFTSGYKQHFDLPEASLPSEEEGRLTDSSEERLNRIVF